MTEQSVKMEQTETTVMTDLMDKMEKIATLCRSSLTIPCGRDLGHEHHERRLLASPGVVVSPVRSAGSRRREEFFGLS